MAQPNNAMSLKTICTEEFVRIFIQMISRPILNRSSLEEYISYASTHVLEISLSMILSSSTLTPLQRFRSLEILLRQDVAALRVGYFPVCYIERILGIIMEQGTGLRYLNIEYVSMSNNAELLCDIVRAAPNLKVLVLSDMVMIKKSPCFTSTPNSSRYLNLASEYVSSSSLDSSSFLNESLQNPNNRDVRRREFSLRNIYELVENLISYLSNLRAVHRYSNNGWSVLFIHNTESRVSLNLTYLLNAFTTYAAIVKLCQELEMIPFRFPGEGYFLRFSLWNIMVSVQFTKILRNRFTMFLLNSDSNLRNIRKYICDPVHVPTMRNIVNSHCNTMYIEMSNSDIFLFLSDIELVDCDLSDDNVKLILIKSPFLRKVLIGSDVNLQDEDIDTLCQRCHFRYLKELRLSSARNLTINSVEILFLFCCPELTIIGNMDGWGATSEEIEEFQNLMVISSMDLTLVSSENNIRKRK